MMSVWGRTHLYRRLARVRHLLYNSGMSFTDKKAQLQQKQMLKMADDNIDLRRQVAELKAQIESVLSLHKEINGPYDDNACEHCTIDENIYYNYPCPTVQALIKPGYCIHDVRMGCEECWK